MKRTSGRIGVGLVLVSTLVGACLTDRDKGDASAVVVGAQPEAALPDARNAKDVVLAVRSQLERGFGGVNVAAPFVLASGLKRTTFDLVGSHVNADAEVYSAPGLSLNTPVYKANVVLPARADGAFRLQDEHSGLSIEVGLMGANASVREDVDGYTVYRAGYAYDAHIVHRTTSEGTEDYVFFPQNLPATPELRYELALGETVAGLRLVSRTLEMLDAGGAPRLRMAPPYAVDGDGKRIALNVSIEGCAYDSSGAMPWGRTPVDPGARHCTVHLTWDGTVKAPLVVDPAWRLTQNMNEPRLNMTATALPNGKVMVVGGDLPGLTPCRAVEAYDHGTFSWTALPDMALNRADHAAVLTPDALYVIGGRTLGTVGSGEKSAEKFIFGQNMWVPLPTKMIGPRSKHTATLVPTKGILVAGGYDYSQPTNSAEFYHFTNGEWTLSSMAQKRAGHTATSLSDSRILVVGGKGDSGAPTSHEIYEHNVPTMTSPWMPFANNTIPHGHANHTATKLPDGRVVIAGGESGTGEPTASVDIFEPMNGNTWKTLPAMSTARTAFAAAISPIAGGLVVMGGRATANQMGERLDSVELLKDGATQWEALAPMSTGRANLAAVALSGGYILAIGGAPGPAGATGGTAEFLGCSKDDECQANNADAYCAVDNTCKPRKKDGEACDLRSAEDGGKDCFQGKCDLCQNHNCVDGVCCNDACDGQCETCNAAGECVAVTGAPITNRAEDNHNLPKRDLCVIDKICGGQCNGLITETCTYPQGNTCEKSCSDGTVETKECDGLGSCSVLGPKELCAPFACDDAGKQCRAGCNADAADPAQSGCDDSSDCKEGMCIRRPTTCHDDNTAKLPNGDLQPCENYRCMLDKNNPEIGACLTECTTAYDCKVVAPGEEPLICDERGQCVARTFDDTIGPATSCSTSPANDSSRFGWLAALALAGVVAARRNRPRA